MASRRRVAWTPEARRTLNEVSSGRFSSASSERLGVLQADARVVDVAASAQGRSKSGDPAFASMQALIEGGAPALSALRALLAEPAQLVRTPLANVRLLAPLPRPEQIRDCLCFEEHLTNLMARTEEARQEPEPGGRARAHLRLLDLQ